jgi:hypothetical protein
MDDAYHGIGRTEAPGLNKAAPIIFTYIDPKYTKIEGP